MPSGEVQSGTLTMVPNTTAVLRSGVIVRSGAGLIIRCNATAPTITAPTSPPIARNASTGPLAFTVGDAEVPVASLIVSVVSTSNPALVPLGNIVLGGSGGNRTVTATAAGSLTGSTSIVLGVSDGKWSSTTAFVVTVLNAAPTIAAAPAADSAVGPQIGLSVLGADDGGEENLTYTWSQMSGPETVIFPTGNGSNAAKQLVVTCGTVGTYALQVLIADQGGLQVSAPLTATITGQRPVVSDQTFACAANISYIQRSLSATSPSGGAVTFTLSGLPAHGTASIEDGTSIRYTPNQGYSGRDVCLVVANDGVMDSVPGTITMVVGADAERSVLLRPTIAETFDATRWANDAAYQTTYLAASVPARVWATASGVLGVPLLQIVGPASIGAMVNGSVTLSVQARPFAPVSFAATGNGTFAGNVNAITVQADSSGVASVAFTSPGIACRCPVLIGSPVAVGTQRIVVEVVP